MPRRYDLLLEYGAELRNAGRFDEAAALFARSVDVSPRRREGWVLLGELNLRTGRYRDAHRIAMEGLRVAGQDAEFWRIASEAYIGAGFLPAALRARLVAQMLDPEDPSHAERLEELQRVIGEERSG
jgi:tetratricopeptide (TPR) repeat protein